MHKSLSCAALLLLFLACGGTRQVEKEKPAATALPAKVVHFYASPGVVARGETTTICYGVENTRSVRLDPPVEDIKPSPNRCFGLVPRESRTYTLVALGDDGIEVRESFRIQVDDKPAAPARKQDSMIQFFTANATEVPTGQNVTICYGVQGAHKLTLHPGSRPLEPVPRNCIMTRVTEATTFKLVADGPSGRVETESLTIRTR